MKRLIFLILIFIDLNCYCTNPLNGIKDTTVIANKSKIIIYQTAEIEKYRNLLKADFANVLPKYAVTCWKLPFILTNRSDLRNVRIISSFAVYRKSNYKGHKHSGIDIIPLIIQDKYVYVYPLANGVVCFVRVAPPYTTVVIKHKLKGDSFIYTSYIHLKEVNVKNGQHVDQNTIIGRLFTHGEALQYKGPYDHLHLEIRKIFDDYSCATYLCMSLQKLEEYFFNPVSFLKENL